MVKIIKNPWNGRLNNLNDPVLNVLGFASSSLNMSSLRPYSSVNSAVNRGSRNLIYCLMSKPNFLKIICSLKFGVFVFISWSFGGLHKKARSRNLAIGNHMRTCMKSEQSQENPCLACRHTTLGCRLQNCRRAKKEVKLTFNPLTPN